MPRKRIPTGRPRGGKRIGAGRKSVDPSRDWAIVMAVIDARSALRSDAIEAAYIARDERFDAADAVREAQDQLDRWRKWFAADAAVKAVLPECVKSKFSPQPDIEDATWADWFKSDAAVKKKLPKGDRPPTGFPIAPNHPTPSELLVHIREQLKSPNDDKPNGPIMGGGNELAPRLPRDHRRQAFALARDALAGDGVVASVATIEAAWKRWEKHRK
jgi:hypothetical protein